MTRSEVFLESLYRQVPGDPTDEEELRGAVRSARRQGNHDLLMLAVLQDAVDCIQKYCFSRNLQQRKLFDEAREWVQSNDASWLFAFRVVCEQLGIEPEYIRKGLILWTSKKRQGRTTAHKRQSKIKIFVLHGGKE